MGASGVQRPGGIENFVGGGAMWELGDGEERPHMRRF